MSKTNKTIVALVVIVLLLIVGYMLLGNGATTEPTTETPVEGEVQGAETQATDEAMVEGADTTEVVVEGDVVVEEPIAE